MGTWGPRSFENDDAQEIVATAMLDHDLAPLRLALQKVIDVGQEYLEAPEAQAAVAVAEIVALLRTGPDSAVDYDEELLAWSEDAPEAPPAVADQAHRALTRILSHPSELSELWRESEDYSTWKGNVEHTISRLSRRGTA